MNEEHLERRTLGVLVEGGRYFEGPRWHGDRLWVSDTLARSVFAIDEKGARELVCQADDIPCGLGHLPGGDLVVLGMFQKRLWVVSKGALAAHADLSSIASGTIDDMIVDARGNAYSTARIETVRVDVAGTGAP